MKAFHFLAAAALLLPASAAVAESVGCPTAEVCRGDEYGIYVPPKGTCPPKVCKPIDEAPGAIIECTRTWSGHACKAWPRGEVTHRWSVTLPLTLQSQPGNETAAINCNGTRGSTVMLTVTSPVGLSSTTSVSLSCDRTIPQ